MERRISRAWLTLAVGTVGCICPQLPTSAQEINFEEFPSGTRISTQYPGVTFAGVGGAGEPPVILNTPIEISCSDPNALFGFDPDDQLEITFDEVQGEVSFCTGFAPLLVGETGFLSIQAFSATDDVVFDQSLFRSGPEFGDINLPVVIPECESYPGISRVVIRSTSGGISQLERIDDLNFEPPTPEIPTVFELVASTTTVTPSNPTVTLTLYGRATDLTPGCDLGIRLLAGTLTAMDMPGSGSIISTSCIEPIEPFGTGPTCTGPDPQFTEFEVFVGGQLEIPEPSELGIDACVPVGFITYEVTDFASRSITFSASVMRHEMIRRWMFVDFAFSWFVAESVPRSWVFGDCDGDRFGGASVTIDVTSPPPCPCPTSPNLVRTYEVTGAGSATPWSWCIRSDRGDFSEMCDLSVTGVIGSALDVAQAFANSINAAAGARGCGPDRILAQASDVFGTVILSIRTSCDAPFTLSVGPSGTRPTCDVIATLPACSFNPDIEELLLPGEDCNDNGFDDFVDITRGTSSDVNQNGIPDECENSCRADWNGDGMLNSDDFFAFISDFLDGEADYNLDQVTNSEDFFIFVEEFLLPPSEC